VSSKGFAGLKHSPLFSKDWKIRFRRPGRWTLLDTSSIGKNYTYSDPAGEWAQVSRPVGGDGSQDRSGRHRDRGTGSLAACDLWGFWYHRGRRLGGSDRASAWSGSHGDSGHHQCEASARYLGSQQL